MDRKRIINLLIGSALFLACGFLLPEAVFTTFAARAAVGTIAWMAYWWITAPIDYAVTAFLPIVIVLVVVNILFMLRDVKKEESLGGSRDYFIQEYKKMPPMTIEEKWSLALFVIATVLAFTRSLYQDLIPGLKPGIKEKN